LSVTISLCSITPFRKLFKLKLKRAKAETVLPLIIHSHCLFVLHFASMRSHRSWSEILALWWLMNRPPWLNTRSTGADVQGVQKLLSTNCLLSLTNQSLLVVCKYIMMRQRLILTFKYYHRLAKTITGKSWKFSRLFWQDQDQDQDFCSKTKTKTKALGLKTKTKTKTLFLSSRRLETKTLVSRTTSLHNINRQ